MQTVLITGASSGIGNATARYFFNEGWQVVATMRDLSARHDLPADPRMDLLQLDVSDPHAIDACVRAVIAKHGAIDVLVNNAGYGLLGPLEAMTHEDIAQQFAVNVIGLMDVTRVVIPHMRERKQGAIVNVSSMMGRISFPFFSPYVATKWAVEGFSETLAIELSDFNIRVRLVEPGAIKTRFFDDAHAVSREGMYAARWRRVWEEASGRGKSGADARVAAAVIYRAATSTSSRMRYSVDLLSKLLPFLRRISPLSLYHAIMRRTVG